MRLYWGLDVVLRRWESVIRVLWETGAPGDVGRGSEEVWRGSEEVWRGSEEVWRGSEEVWREERVEGGSEEMADKICGVVVRSTIFVCCMRGKTRNCGGCWRGKIRQ